jgi:hypothetical protein
MPQSFHHSLTTAPVLPSRPLPSSRVRGAQGYHADFMHLATAFDNQQFQDLKTRTQEASGALGLCWHRSSSPDAVAGG